MNEERGTTALEGGHIALFLLNIWYLVFPCPLSGGGVRGPAFRRPTLIARSGICRAQPSVRALACDDRSY